MAVGKRESDTVLDIRNRTVDFDEIPGLYSENAIKNFGFEQLFPFQQVKNVNTKFTRKKPMKYTYGNQMFNAWDKIMSYSDVQYKEGYLTLDNDLVFARQYAAADKLTPALVDAELSEIAGIEAATKRMSIINALERDSDVLFASETKITKDNVMSLHDKIVDTLSQKNINNSSVVILVRYEFIRAYRDLYKIANGSSILINDVLTGLGIQPSETLSMVQTIEGITYIGVPTYQNQTDKDGNVIAVKSFKDDTIGLAVDISRNFTEKPVVWAAQMIHTDLRVEINGVGNGKGAVPILEYTKTIGSAVADPQNTLCIKFGEETAKEVEINLEDTNQIKSELGSKLFIDYYRDSTILAKTKPNFKIGDSITIQELNALEKFEYKEIVNGSEIFVVVYPSITTKNATSVNISRIEWIKIKSI